MEYIVFTAFTGEGEILVLGFIGAGNMATAILDGVLKSKLFEPSMIVMSNPHSDKLSHAQSMGVHVTTSNQDVARTADLVIVAVKPQKYDVVLSELKDDLAGKCIISIAAGISSEWIHSRIPNVQVVRVMPNTPLQLGVGATAIAQAPDVNPDMFQTAYNIFAASGTVVIIPECQMDSIIPVSGSSPAFFFRMVDVMVSWATEQGIDPDVALQMASSAMKGSAEMLLESGKSADELTRQVCSPGGTTLAALTVFDDKKFNDLIADAMTRCAERSKELSQ